METDAPAKRIAEMRSEGARWQEIAEELGISQAAARHNLADWLARQQPRRSGTDTRHLVDVQPGDDRRASDRKAMRRLIAGRGFEHAVESVAQAVAVELVEGETYDADKRLEQMADQAADAVLDSLCHLARSHGWSPA